MPSPGRPSVMTELALQKLREAFLFGCTDDEACLFADISPATLYNYQNENSEYLEQKKAWKQNPVMLARKTVFEKTATDGDLALRYLERKKKDEFSLKTESEIKSDNTLTITWKYIGDSNTVHTSPTLPTDTPQQ